MNLLALDTSSIAWTATVQVGDKRVERHEEQPREHTRLIVPMIAEALESASIAAEDLDGIVLGNGPGSFIGMRIATSIAQGMAQALGLRIAPVSSLQVVALAVFAETDASHVLVTQDAHMDEVYLGIYARNSAQTIAETLQRQSAIDGVADYERPVAAGAGWRRYPALAEANHEHIASFSSQLYPQAPWLLEAGRAVFEQGAAVAPGDVVPAYLRQTVAQKAPTKL